MNTLVVVMNQEFIMININLVHMELLEIKSALNYFIIWPNLKN